MPKAPEGLIMVSPTRAVSFPHPGIIVPVLPGHQLAALPKGKKPKPIQPAVQSPATTLPVVGSSGQVTVKFEAKAPNSPPTITTLLGLHPEDLSLGAESATLKDVTLGNNGPPSFVG